MVKIKNQYIWKDIKDPSKGGRILRELYWDLKFSLKGIGRLYNKTDVSILNYMQKYNIPRRSNSESVSIAMTTFAQPFSENLIEKAYLIGLRFSDLTVTKSRRKIRVSVETTHPAMIELLQKSFSQYARVKPAPRFRKQTKVGSKYRWECYCYLDESFSFLLKKGNLPSWIKTKANYFVPFLAGFIDGDGYIAISPHRDKITMHLGIEGENYEVLDSIRKNLIELGYHPLFKLKNKAGTYSNQFKFSNDCWSMMITRQDEVVELLKKLPLLHNEKIAKKKLASKAQKSKYWLYIKEDIEKIRRKIKKETDLCTKKAKKVWKEKHENQ